MSEPVSGEEKAVALVQFMGGFYIAIIATVFCRKQVKLTSPEFYLLSAKGSVLTLEHLSCVCVCV